LPYVAYHTKLNGVSNKIVYGVLKVNSRVKKVKFGLPQIKKAPWHRTYIIFIRFMTGVYIGIND